MTLNVGGFTFNGPFLSTSSIKNKSGVYVILCEKKQNQFSLIDVGESSEVKTRLENQGRKKCWKNNCKGTLHFAVYYTPNIQTERIKVEQELRDQYNPPCGKT